MRLIKAEFTNFRMLRDVVIDFSGDPDKHLTVIRAENDSGKTTLLRALQWALYGTAGLPRKGVQFRLHPVGEWEEGQSFRIEATIKFERPLFQNNPNQPDHLEDSAPVYEQYELKRSVTEVVSGTSTDNYDRTDEQVQLLKKTSKGYQPLENPQFHLNDFWSPALREVFFTDGDRALTFIEDSSQRNKREKVQEAIRSLLGLDIVESGKEHISGVKTEIQNEIKQLSSSDDERRLSEKISSLSQEQIDIQEEKNELAEKSVVVEEEIQRLEKEKLEILQRGNKKDLENDIKRTKERITRLELELEQLNKQNADLLSSEFLGSEFLKKYVLRASSQLEILKGQGQIPTDARGFVRERIQMEKCICGESLKKGTTGHTAILKLLEEEHERSEYLSSLTDLYFQSQQLVQDCQLTESVWSNNYRGVANKRFQLEKEEDESNKRLKELDMRLKALGDADIDKIMSLLRSLLSSSDTIKNRTAEIAFRLKQINKELENLEKEQKRVLRQNLRYKKIQSVLDATNDLFDVFSLTHKQLLTEEMTKVSEQTNRYFLQIIAGDSEQNTIVKECEITEDFDIKVYSDRREELDPDRDLNGASRRALTMSFILALTQVSGVNAPNVIDTPLGMTSGEVRKNLLKTTFQESSQLILMLTRSEIDGCEDLLDQYAGQVVTMTNSAHYPMYLVNDPAAEYAQSIICDCNHLQVCPICELTNDSENESLENRISY